MAQEMMLLQTVAKAETNDPHDKEEDCDQQEWRQTGHRPQQITIRSRQRSDARPLQYRRRVVDGEFEVSPQCLR